MNNQSIIPITPVIIKNDGIMPNGTFARVGKRQKPTLYEFPKNITSISDRIGNDTDV